MPIRFVASTLLAATVLLAGGCWYPGYRPAGSQASRDQFTYESTPNFQQRITLKNTRTGETIWEMEVPIGKQLVIWFYDTQKTGDPENPSVMRWELMKRGHESGDLDNALPVPGPTNRRVDVTLVEDGQEGSLPAPERSAY